MTRDPARMHRYDEGTEALAHAVLAYALERVRLDPPPLDRPRTSAELDRLGESITADGMGSMAALRLFCEHLAPACITQDHPRQLAFVPSAPTEAAVLFDLVVGASCIYAGSWMEGAGAVWAENHALRWIADLVGLPAAAGGVFLSGGSAGNLSALVAARHRARAARPDGDGRPRWWVAASAGVHASVEAAARVMDVEVLKVPTDGRGRMTGDALRAELWRAGLVGPNSAPAGGEAGAGPVGVGPVGVGGSSPEPANTRSSEQVMFAVVATAGTTNAGAIDELDAIADVCQTHGLWLHVDAAYGGAALVAPTARPLFSGIERADSFVVDPHKWLFAPYDCAALLYRDPANAAAAHAQHAGYLDVLHDDGDWNPSDYAFHLTRRARGLPFWYSLVTHGTEAYADAVEASLSLARRAAELISAHRELELLAEPQLSVVLFRRRGWDKPRYEAWSDQLLADQIAFCVPTTWRGETVLRFCFIHPRTTTDDVRAILATLG